MIDVSINPLNVLNKRRLNYIPVHFETIQIDGAYSLPISAWVYENTKSRFAIAKKTKIVHNNIVSHVALLGFEDPKEMILTILKCPFIKERK